MVFLSLFSAVLAFSDKISLGIGLVWKGEQVYPNLWENSMVPWFYFVYPSYLLSFITSVGFLALCCFSVCIIFAIRHLDYFPENIFMLSISLKRRFIFPLTPKEGRTNQLWSFSPLINAICKLFWKAYSLLLHYGTIGNNAGQDQGHILCKQTDSSQHKL